MAILIDGKALSKQVRAELQEQVANMTVTPGLAVVLVGEDSASQIYVRNKIKACKQIGIASFQHRLPESVTQQQLLTLIGRLNDDPLVHGILVQLPLPRHIKESDVLRAISPAKDVDAFHPVNVGQIVEGNYFFAPCTPSGVMEMLDHYEIPIEGKHCVVVGRSNIVGKPQALLLLHRHGTVTIAHSRTPDLGEITRLADILVVAVGKSKLIKGDMVKPGAVVIDVGMNRDADGKLSGDVDFDEVEQVASYISPVPGGVGLMTTAMLMRNTVRAAQAAQGLI